MDVVQTASPTQCVALTDKGKGPRCRYHGKHVHPNTGKRYCGHHYKAVAPAPAPKAPPKGAAAVTKAIGTFEVAPLGPSVPVLELTIPFQLRRKVAQKLRRRLAAGPKTNDEPGLIYVYYLQHEAGLNYFKVGRTGRDPQKRHKEWQAQHHADHTVVTKKTWQVDARAVKFVEAVIHLYFDYCRMYRYPVDKTSRLLSVWSATGSPIRDADYTALEQDAESGGGGSTERRTVARRKMVEWFWVMWPELDALITRVCGFYSGPLGAGAAEASASKL